MVYPPLPLFVVLADGSPSAEPDRLVAVGDTACLPVFTSLEKAHLFMRIARAEGIVARCNARRLLSILGSLNPPGIVFDPHVSRRNAVAVDPNRFMAWLEKKSDRQQ